MAARKSIDTVELAASLAGKEGVDANHTSRIRVQALLDQNQALGQQAQFADAKAAGLVTVVGILALNGPFAQNRADASDPLTVVTAGLAALCILFCMLSVFPRYPSRATRQTLSDIDRFSWPSLTAPGFDADAYARYMQTAEVSQIVYSIARSNSSISQILLRKFLMLRIAFSLAIGLFALILVRRAGLY